MQAELRKGMRPVPKTFSYSEERFLREKEKTLEDELKKKEIQQGVSHEPRDPQEIEKKLKSVQGQLRNFAADRIEGKERVQAELEIKKIEDRLKKFWGGEFPTYRSYWMTPKEGIDYLNLVDKIVETNTSREYSELVRRWKALRRRLEPQDRRIDSTLHLFRK